MTDEEITANLHDIIARGHQAAAKRRQDEEQDAIAEQQAEARDYRRMLEYAGLPAWMNRYLEHKVHNAERWYTLSLPGCSPLVFTVTRFSNGAASYSNLSAREATGVHFDADAEAWVMRWQNSTIPGRIYDLDEAIALAFDLGESWHAIKTEAARRDAEGLRPNPSPGVKPEQPALPSAPYDERIAVALERIADRLELLCDAGVDHGGNANAALRINALR